MKYSELKEKVSRGKWTQKPDDFIYDHDHWHQTQYIRANKGDTVIALTTECHGFWTPEQVQANARLIVHQHEHFDKLLEALKQASSMLPNNYARQSARKTLEAAQTVKEI